jgi:hypothetical protein
MEPLQTEGPLDTAYTVAVTQDVLHPPRTASDSSRPVVHGLTVNAIEGLAFLGRVGSFTAAETPGQRRPVWRASIDWGDGSKPTRGLVLASGAGSFDIIGRHTYLAAGQYALSAKVRLIRPHILPRILEVPGPPPGTAIVSTVDAFPALTYTVQGGIGGIRQTTEVHPDGSFSITGLRRSDPPEEGQLTRGQRAQLCSALAGWSELQDEYGHFVFDGYTLDVTFADKRVRVLHGADIPAAFRSVVRILQRLGNGRPPRGPIPQL